MEMFLYSNNVVQPYNFERILFYLTDGNTSLVKEWMATMEETQKLKLDPTWHARLQTDFESACITDNETCLALKRTSDALDYIVDPHTAVAIAAADELGYPIFHEEREQKNPLVIFATASPCKFQEAVTVALGQNGWDRYMQNEFPARALKTMDMDEKEPYSFKWPEGASLETVQCEWQKEMLGIVENSFALA